MKKSYNIWDIIKTPNVDIMVIGKRYIPDINTYWYLIPSPVIRDLCLIWVTQEKLDSYDQDNQ